MTRGVTFQQDDFDKHRYHVRNMHGQPIGLVRLDTTSDDHEEFGYRFESTYVSLNLREVRTIAGFIEYLDKINKRNAGRGKMKSSDENER
jgi:hypothetical protein